MNPDQVAGMQEHLPTVEKMASKLAAQCRTPVEDLVSAGKIGLANALVKHDGRDGFRGFAYFHIRGAMMDYLRWKCRPARPPQIHATCAPGALPDSTDSHEAAIDMRELVRSLVDSLPPRMQRIIRMRFFENMNYREMGDELGVCSERVRQLVQHALKTLKRRAGP